MYEIEAKVWVKDKQKWNQLKTQVKKLALFLREEQKEDWYFSNQTQKVFFRLRTNHHNKTKITIKNKKIVQGIEENQEDSFEIKDKKSFLIFAKKIGFQVSLKKTKTSLIYQKDKFLIELNSIPLLGNFLEIEQTCQKKSEIPQIKKSLQTLFASLGFTPQNFEKTSYYQLLLAQN